MTPDERARLTNEHVLLCALIDKLPTFDPTWEDEVRKAWVAAWKDLWAWGCRLDVEWGVAEYVAASEHYHRSEGQRRRWETWRRKHGYFA